MTITYPYLDDDRVERTASWTGERSEALDAAIDYLDAEQSEDDTAEYIYHDDATDRDWASDEDDLIELGAAILGGEGTDHYSLWCAGQDARQIG